MSSEDKCIEDLRELIILEVPIQSPVAITDDITIPSGIVDLASFRNWCYSADFPRRGRIDYLNGRLFIDVSFQQLYWENQVGLAVLCSIMQYDDKHELGYYVSRRVRISNPEADWSVEPDGMFLFFDSFRRNRVRGVSDGHGDYIELEGTSDLMVEILSDVSSDKDTIELPESYRLGDVKEFWRINAMDDNLRFEILTLTDAGYVATKQDGNWLHSHLFGQWFQMVQSRDQLGDPDYRLLRRY